MRKYWVTIASGEYGYLWSDHRPDFAEFVTITCVRPDQTIYKTSGLVYKVE